MANRPTARVFEAWQPEHTAGWNRRSMNVPHTLHREPLFGLEALAALIDLYPRDAYALVHTSRGADDQRRWREGDIAGVPGRHVIDMIAGGSMWLNLRDVGRHSPAHGALIDAAYAELVSHLPGFDPRAVKMGILISSPSAQVPYHCDLPGQALWQISGRKRVTVYPPKAPFLEPEALENIAYSGFEFKLQYRPEFDAAADTEVFELEPGGMLTWPLNSPHRVDNHDSLNISVTTEHWTGANRRAQRMLLANGVLRHRLHWAPTSRALDGPGYWAKSVLQAAWRRSPWAARTQGAHRPVEFRLDRGAPGGISDAAPPAR
jgi:hypothetical protein